MSAKPLDSSVGATTDKRKLTFSDKKPIFTYTDSFKILAIGVLTKGRSISRVEKSGDIKLSEKVKKLSGNTAISIEEILGMLSNDELNRLEEILASHPESHLVEIFKVFHDGERVLDFFRQKLISESGQNSVSDLELIKYLELLALEVGNENEVWKFHKLIALLYAKNGRYGDAIDHLNKTLRFESEENLWRVCVHIGIYFEKMGDHEFARSFLTTAEKMNKNRASYIERILAICSRKVKKLELQEAA